MPNSARLMNATDLDRINACLSQSKIPSATHNLDESLRVSSSSRVAKWTNTIEAQQNAFQIARHERLQRQELERRQADMENAKMHHDDRLKIITRANKMLESDNDRFRTFNSSMMLSDILIERENQIRIKTELINLESLRERKYEELVKHNHMEMKRREEKAKLETIHKKVNVAKFQKMQIELAQHARLQQEALRAIEYEHLLAIDNSHALEDNEKKLKHKGKLLQATRETNVAKKYMEELKKREAENHLQEMRTIEKYSMIKDKQAAIRKERSMSLRASRILQREEIARLSKPRSKDRVSLGSTDVTDNILDESQASMELAQNNRKLAEELRTAIKENEKKTEFSNTIVKQNVRDSVNDLTLSQKIFADNISQSRKELQYAVGKEHQLSMSNGINDSSSMEDETCGDFIVVTRAKNAADEEIKKFNNYAKDCINEYKESDKNIAPLSIALHKYNNTQVYS